MNSADFHPRRSNPSFARRLPPLAGSSGFTLVEIAFAVAILALAFTSIIAIQSNVVAAALADRNRLNAALFAQYLLTASELDAKKPEPGTTSGNLPEMLKDAGWLENGTADHLAEFNGWTAQIDIVSLDLLEFADALRRIDLTISWGPEAASSYRVTYFVPGEAKVSTQ